MFTIDVWFVWLHESRAYALKPDEYNGYKSTLIVCWLLVNGVQSPSVVTFTRSRRFSTYFV